MDAGDGWEPEISNFSLAQYNDGQCAMTTTAEPATFDDLLPRLIDEYALPRGELTAAHSLADKANRLAPAFAALSENIWTALPADDCSSPNSLRRSRRPER